ncbi:MAG: Antitoxin [Gemmatimonadetes bacterium]|nr:Antitoxin [Gemmatimonadota bacterium]
MSTHYSIAEARSRLPTIVDQAESGVEVLLTRRGKLVAAVVGLRALERLREHRPEFGATYRDFLARYSLDDVGLEAEAFAEVRGTDDGRKVTL